jgi:hypothetical protein
MHKSQLGTTILRDKCTANEKLSLIIHGKIRLKENWCSWINGLKRGAGF